jgi:hypothetical protein
MLLRACHAAGQSAVADDGHDVTVAMAQDRVGLRDAVGPAQRGRRVRVLHDVMDRLRTARVARQAAALAQCGEVLPAGQQLVDVRLVARVEHDRVAGRLEHPVDGDRQLDDTEVGAQVAAGPRDGLHEEVADLLGQRADLRMGQPAQVSRCGDAGEDSHAHLPSSCGDAAARRGCPVATVLL